MKKSLRRRLTENSLAQCFRNLVTRFSIWRKGRVSRFENWLETKSPLVPRRIQNKVIERVNKNADYRVSEAKKENEIERQQLREMISQYYRVGVERPSRERYRVVVEIDGMILRSVRGGLHEEMRYLAHTIGRQIEHELASVNFARAIGESRYDEFNRPISWIHKPSDTTPPWKA